MKRNTEIKLKVVEWNQESNLVILQTPKGTYSINSEEFLKFIETATLARKTREQSAHKFIPPTAEEAEAYAQERQNGINGQYFVDFYQSKNWKVGNSKMIDWKASMRTWENKNRNNGKSNNQNTINGSYSNKKAGDKVSGVAGIVAGIGYQEFTSDS